MTRSRFGRQVRLKPDTTSKTGPPEGLHDVCQYRLTAVRDCRSVAKPWALYWHGSLVGGGAEVWDQDRFCGATYSPAPRTPVRLKPDTTSKTGPPEGGHYVYLPGKAGHMVVRPEARQPSRRTAMTRSRFGRQVRLKADTTSIFQVKPDTWSSGPKRECVIAGRRGPTLPRCR